MYTVERFKDGLLILELPICSAIIGILLVKLSLDMKFANIFKGCAISPFVVRSILYEKYFIFDHLRANVKVKANSTFNMCTLCT